MKHDPPDKKIIYGIDPLYQNGCYLFKQTHPLYTLIDETQIFPERFTTKLYIYLSLVFFYYVYSTPIWGFSSILIISFSFQDAKKCHGLQSIIINDSMGKLINAG